MQNPFKLLAGRRRKAPKRDTDLYPRLLAIGGRRLSNKRVSLPKATPQNLRRFSRTVYARRAINAIRNPVTQLAWEITAKPGITKNAALKAQIETATYCFEHPNQIDSFSLLLTQVLEDYLAVSAGVIEQQLGSDPERPLWMWPVDAQSIQIVPSWDGKESEARYMQVLGYGNVGTMEGKPLLNREIIYMRPNPSTDTPYGYGPLEIAFRTISRKLGVEDYAGNVASNSQPKNLLFFKGADRQAIQAFREYWTNEVEGQGQTPMVGGEAAEAVVLHGGRDEELYLKYQEMLVREIAAAFDLSPQNLGVERDVNRNTSEVAEDRDWDQVIKPTARMVEEHLTREALHGRLGFHNLCFKFLGIDREDEQATASIYQTYYNTNVLTPNEQRKKLGLEPSKSRWADMLNADYRIASKAATSAKQVYDPALGKPNNAPQPQPPAPATQPSASPDSDTEE